MKQITLVFGPGRSGTSMVAQVIAQTEIALGDNLIEGNSFNPDGYYEDKDIVDLHKKFLGAFGITDTYTGMLPLPTDWLSFEETLDLENQLYACLISKFPNSESVAIKDPRISLLLPIWRKVAERIRADLKCVFCIRHPHSASVSQQKVSGASLPICEAMWLNRVAYGLHYLRNDGLIVDYDSFIEDPSSSLKRILDYISYPRPAPIFTDKLKQFAIKPEYRNQSEEKNSIHREVDKLFRSLRRHLDSETDREEAISVADEIIFSSGEAVGKNESLLETSKTLKKKLVELEEAQYKNNRLKEGRRRDEARKKTLEARLSRLEEHIALTESSKWMRLGNLLKQIRRNPFRAPLIMCKSCLATFFRRR
jgi:hypothetical protein